MRQISVVVLAVITVLGLAAGRLLAAAVLVDDGKQAAVIVLPAQPETDEQLAAEELQQHLRKITGVELAIVHADDPAAGERLPIRIGQAADAALEKQIREQGDDPAAFALRVTDAAVDLRGISAEGTLFASYELLEQLGVRWYIPGDLGTVIPTQNSVSLENQLRIELPDFPSRHLQAVATYPLSKQWYRRARLGGKAFPSAHGFPGLKGKQGKQVFEEHPEFFSLVNGKRTMQQYCVSNPELAAYVIEHAKAYFDRRPETDILGVGPNDGVGHCECDNCKALDSGEYDPFAGSIAKTDRYIYFFNKVLEGLDGKYAEKRLGFYV